MNRPTEDGYYWVKMYAGWEIVLVLQEAVWRFEYVPRPVVEELILEWGDPIIRNPYPERPTQSVELEQLMKGLLYFEAIGEEAAEIINDAIIFMDTLGPMLKLEQQIPKDTIP